MNADAVLHALGLRSIDDPRSVPLASISGRSVSVSMAWSAEAAELAARRATALLVVSGHNGSFIPPDPLDHVDRRGLWPLVVVTDSPDQAAVADFGILVAPEGGADHAKIDESAAADLVARFLDVTFPAQAAEPASSQSLLDIVPFPIDSPYDPAELLLALVDGPDWIELDADGSPEVMTVAARIGGQPVGIAASNPGLAAGRLSPDGCARVDRLRSWCSRGCRPLVSLVDTAGVDPLGTVDDVVALRRAASGMRGATMAKIVVVTGRAIGLGATVMGAVGARADVVLPWPRAAFALADPIAAHGTGATARAASAMRAAEAGDLTDVIHPDDTRQKIIEMLALLRGPSEYGL